MQDDIILDIVPRLSWIARSLTHEMRRLEDRNERLLEGSEQATARGNGEVDRVRDGGVSREPFLLELLLGWLEFSGKRGIGWDVLVGRDVERRIVEAVGVVDLLNLAECGANS